MFSEKITSFQLLTLANIATQSISLIAFWKGRLAISQLVKPNLKDLQLMNNIIPAPANPLRICEQSGHWIYRIYQTRYTGSFRINVKSKMAFMGINFHENWIFGVVLGCLHRDILILWCNELTYWLHVFHQCWEFPLSIKEINEKEQKKFGDAKLSLTHSGWQDHS